MQFKEQTNLGRPLKSRILELIQTKEVLLTSNHTFKTNNTKALKEINPCIDSIMKVMDLARKIQV